MVIDSLPTKDDYIQPNMLYKTGSDDDIVREDKCERESSYKPSREDILDRFGNDPFSELLDNVLDEQNCFNEPCFPCES